MLYSGIINILFTTNIIYIDFKHMAVLQYPVTNAAYYNL